MKGISEVYLIRHGEATCNDDSKLAEMACHRLTEKGKKQVELLFRAIKKHRFDLVVTSDYERAIETARPYLEHYKIKEKRWPVQEFKRISDYKARVKNLEEKRKDITLYWEKCDPDYRNGKGAETFCEYIKRIDVIINKITKSDFKKITIFTHGNFIKHLCWRVLYPKVKINKETMASAGRFGWGMKIRNAEVVKLVKIDGKLYIGQLVGDHIKN